MENNQENTNYDNEISRADEISFEYIKSNLFREIHVDGMIGGLTPKLQLYISFFGERFPTPKKVFQRLNDGQVGDEILEKRDSKNSIIRHMEVGAFMDIEVAKSLYDWLGKQIEVFENLNKADKKD